MDTAQLEMIVNVLGDLGQFSLTGFIVWIGSDFLLKIIAWSISVFFLTYLVKSVASLIRSQIGAVSEDTIENWRNKLGTGTRGFLTPQEKRDTIARVNELVEEASKKRS